MAEPLVVTAAEAGQKLVQYLQRRCGAPQSAIQRWVRTGQVRINGGRCKPFDRVAEGDVVRVPPFALAGGEGDPVVGGVRRMQGRVQRGLRRRMRAEEKSGAPPRAPQGDRIPLTPNRVRVRPVVRQQREARRHQVHGHAAHARNFRHHPCPWRAAPKGCWCC